MFHLMAVHGGEAGEISYETDRARFLGRGRRAGGRFRIVDRAQDGRLELGEQFPPVEGVP